MAYNGSGTFNRLYNWEDDRDADVLIRADRMDAEMDGMATGLSTAICKDGQTTITANLPMAGFRHTGVGNASARTHYAAYGQVQDNAATWGGTAGGTANALTVTMTPTVTALTTGQVIWLKAASTNTGAATLAVDAVAAKNIYHPDGAAIAAGAIISGGIYGFAYDGTQFILISPRNASGAVETSGGTTVTLTSASSRVQSITMTAAEKYVVLPDATTLSEGRDFIIRNAASVYWFGIQDGGGTTIASIPPGVTVNVTLIDNSATAGTWAVHGSAASFYPTAYYPRVPWPFYAGTATSFEGAAIQAPNVCALSATKAIAVYSDSGDSGYGKAAIIDVSGVTPTIGTPATFESADTCTDGVAHRMAVCALSATKALVVYIDTGNSSYGTACVLDVSGSTITPATPAVFESASCDSLSVCALSATKALVVYGDNGNSGFPTACVLDVSGSTITPATPAALDGAATTGSSTVMVSATQALTIYNQVADATYATVLDVSGSTITPATPVGLTLSDGDPQPPTLLSLSSTLFAAAGNTNDIAILGLSGSTVTQHWSNAAMFATLNDNNQTPLFLHKISASRFALFVDSDPTLGDHRLYGLILDVALNADGATYRVMSPSFEHEQDTGANHLHNSNWHYRTNTGANAFALGMCTLSTGKVLFVGQDYAQAGGAAHAVEIVS